MATARRVALLRRSRKRRRSISALPKLHQTRRFPAPVRVDESLPAGAVSRPVTFAVEHRITSTKPSGTILNVGAGDPALTVYYESGLVRFTIGSGSVEADAASGVATRVHSSGQLVRLVVSVRPGDGSVRVWDRQGLLAQSEAENGSIVAWSGVTASDLVVPYASAAGYNTLIRTNPAAPFGFESRRIPRAFPLYVPHHHLKDIADDAVVAEFDEFLFRGTFLSQIALYPLADDSDDGAT